MRIRTISVCGFRGYETLTRIDVESLCVLVGKNDVGKSTILEALDIFFNDSKGCVKLDKDDVNKKARDAGRCDIEIAVEFDSLPEEILIDATNKTTLADEYLLTPTGRLHVVKRYPNGGKEKVYIRALHPSNPSCADLLQKKNTELKKILSDQKLECKDKTRNAEIRKAIWSGQSELDLQELEIEVAKIDTKSIWDQLSSHMPLYTLFQSDRKNSDGDSEVQDPMRLAVKEILEDAEIQRTLISIAETVKGHLDRVASRTLDKLREMNPDVANSLSPRLPDTASLKWADIFKNVSIASDDDIPLNKRGSGVKRLILINFFRAEAERRQQEHGLPHIVYAIEEPETSQHPEHQRALIEALIALSNTDTSQVLLTTHSPEIVKKLKFENLMLVENGDSTRVTQVKPKELPYPSLNEVNYAAFDELSEEYHNELYGYIEAEGELGNFKAGKPTQKYRKKNRDGSAGEQQVVLTEYIRHQIHHPENDLNRRFVSAELKQSIDLMRAYIKENVQVKVEA